MTIVISNCSWTFPVLLPAATPYSGFRFFVSAVGAPFDPSAPSFLTSSEGYRTDMSCPRTSSTSVTVAG